MMTATEVVTLKEYIEMRINALEQARNQAYLTMEKRLEGMNEFRETIRDQNAKFVTKTEMELLLKPIAADIKVLNNFKATLEGVATQKSLGTTTIIAILGIVLSLISLVINIIQ